MARWAVAVGLLAGVACAFRPPRTVMVRGGSSEYDEEDEDCVLRETWIEDEDEEEQAEAPARLALEALWRSRVETRAPRHPSYERFREELAAHVGGAKTASKLLSPATCARLLGTAILAFHRETLLPHLTTLPRVSRGARLTAKAPHAVQEALAYAVARALGVKFVAVDEQKLRKVRREAQIHKPISKEEAVAALCRVASEEPVVVWIRDDCVLKSRRAAAVMRDAVVDDASRAVYLFATARRKSVAAPAGVYEEPHDDEEDDSDVSGMFERALKELATRVAAQARRASADNHPSRDYLEALGEALGDESMLKALAESWAPMLKDPQVKVHVALSLQQPQKQQQQQQQQQKMV